MKKIADTVSMTLEKNGIIRKEETAICSYGLFSGLLHYTPNEIYPAAAGVSAVLTVASVWSLAPIVRQHILFSVAFPCDSRRNYEDI